MTSISTLGAIAALVVAIVLILRKVSPAYGMMAGALVGGLIGGADLLQTVSLMVSGAQGIALMPYYVFWPQAYWRAY